MQLARWIFAGAALALACSTVQGADSDRKRDLPGFYQMDKDRDGALSRAEVAANPELARRFAEADGDSDGKLGRYEYLKAMARDDFRALRERVADFIEPEEESATSGDTKLRR